MKTAILALTCGRADLTEKTWYNNLKGFDGPLYWWDNTDTELRHTMRSCEAYPITKKYESDTNAGIAVPFNRMMDDAFTDGADMVITMANDILEPIGWVELLERGMREIPDAGVVSIPPGDNSSGVLRYNREQAGSLTYEVGTVIGNMAISRRCWAVVGNWYEGYGIYGPIDLDYCARVRAAGLKTCYLSDYQSKHIGVNNPTDYQAAKNESLRKSWPLYHERMRGVKRGKV